MSIVVVLKRFELSREIRGVPERNLIQIVSTDRTDQALNEWVRQRHQRYGLDFVDVENPQIRLPAMKLAQGIILREQRAFADEASQNLRRRIRAGSGRL